MTWKQRYRVASYLRSSLWIIAVTAVMLEKLYLLPEDLALARVPDSQGLGGSGDIDGPKWAT